MNNSRDESVPLSKEKQTLLTIQRLQHKYNELQKARTEPIAVIGMSCRFPGGANSPTAFWEMLCAGTDAVHEIPPERWDINEFYSPDSYAAGKMNSRAAGLLDHVDLFDAAFFGISPREAASMDPQQRIFLEVAWEALERSGQDMQRLAGSSTGVFVGVANNDYYHMQLSSNTIDGTYTETGNRQSFISGRTSYLFDFKGPALTVDTVCSSSLVAVHLACQSLRNKESDLALAGSVNLLLSPTFSILASQLQVLSPDGQCKTFDAAANGFVRGEGCGVVVLKRLSDALAAGDPIVGLIRGSAVNQDGRSTALTAPNVLSQQELIEQALKKAEVDPALVSYVETHGTSTPLGDPIEVTALTAVVGQPRTNNVSCYLGAVKTNIGHLEATSGMASLIKALLCLQHHAIPPNLHFHRLNPHISLDNTPFLIPTSMQSWETGDIPHYAGVSAFGLSGTNAHVILEEAPHLLLEQPNTPASSSNDEAPALLTLSARNPQALHDLLEQYHTFLQDNPESFQNICYTASVRRTHHQYRFACVAQNKAECAESLQVALTQTQPEETHSRQKKNTPGKVVFVFPGQGSQWQGMGRQLLAQEAVFARAIEACEAAFAPYVSWSLRHVLLDPEPEALRPIQVLQPVLFAMQVSLAALWRHWGIEPDAVIGHSMGEVAAAVVAEALSLEDAACIICRRSQGLQALVGRGAMLLVELGTEEAQARLAPWQQRVSVAVSNSARSTVLSGEVGALEQLGEQLAREGVFCRWVKVDVASHSPQVDALRVPLLQALEGIAPHEGQLAFYSTVRAESLSGSELDAAYWMENLRQPVRFAQTVTKLLSDEGEATFLELSAHPILTLAIEENLRTAGQQGQVYGSMQRDKNERDSLLASVAGLYERGYDLQWEAIFPPARHRCVPLPIYPWQHERFWTEEEASPQQSSSSPAKRSNSGSHPFLSEPLPLPTSPASYSWQILLHTELASYLQDHRIYDLVVLPGAAYIEIALSAVKQIPEGKGKSWFIENVQFKAMLPITHDMPQQFQLIVKMEDAQQIAFQFFSLELDGQSQASSWILHAEGTLRELVTASEEEWLFSPQMPKSFSSGSIQRYQSATFADIRSRCQTPLSKEQYYAKLSASGLNYGARFQGIQQIWRCDGEALAKLQLASLDTTHYSVHPALLDAALQTLLATMPSITASQEQAQATYLPVAIGDLRLYQQPTADAWVHVAIQPSEPVQGEQQTQLTGNITVLQPDGAVALQIRGLQVQRLEAANKKQNELEQWFYIRDWELQEVPPAGRNAITASPGTQQTTWLVFSNEQRISSALKAHIEQQGGHSILVTGGDRYTRLNTHHYQIHPAHPQDYQTLLKDACPPSAPCAGIIYLWSLSIEQPRRGIDAEAPPADLRSLLLPMRNTTLERKAIPLWSGDIYPGDDLSARDLQKAEAVTCNSTLFLVQALAQASWRHAPRLWLVTQGVEATELSPQVRGTAQSLLWGLGLTILYEHPALRCTCIDLSPEVSAAELKVLCQACQIDEPEAHLVLRGKSRYAARLRRTEIQAPLSNALFRADGTYLITGGLGGLGLTIAEWMAGQGAGTLVLLGRTAPNEQTQVIMEKIRQSGTNVQVQQADVADTAQLATVLASIRTNLPPLRGIFHAAGVLDDVLLVNMQPRHFQRVMGAKVQGAWHLHTLTQQDPLDYFVLFSSAASLLGSPGQGNYAAANAFLDALAFLRQGQELPALSINWGPWSDVGLAISGENRGKRLAQMGIGGISSSQGVEALGRLLSQEEAPVQVGVLPLNLRQWRQSYPSIAGLPFFADAQEDKTAEQAQQAISMHEQLAEADPTRQQTLLEDFLRQQIAQVLRMVPSKIDRHTSFRLLGLESLVAVELRNRLENNLGMALPVTIVWTYPTVQTLAEYLLIKLTSELVEEETTVEIEEAQAQHSDDPQPRESTDASNMEHLTDEEISQLLIEELQDIQDTLLD